MYAPGTSPDSICSFLLLNNIFNSIMGKKKKICLEFIYSECMVSKLCVRVFCFYSADIMHTPHDKNASASISLFSGKSQEMLFKLPWKDGRLNKPNLDVTLMFFLDFSLNSWIVNKSLDILSRFRCMTH